MLAIAIILIVGGITTFGRKYMRNIIVPLQRVTSLSLEPVNMLPYMSRDFADMIN